MLLFRSEEHVERWLTQRALQHGYAFSIDQCWGIADDWYRRKLDPDWRRFTPDEAHAIFARHGLTGDFWRLG